MSETVCSGGLRKSLWCALQKGARFVFYQKEGNDRTALAKQRCAHKFKSNKVVSWVFPPKAAEPEQMNLRRATGACFQTTRGRGWGWVDVVVESRRRNGKGFDKVFFLRSLAFALCIEGTSPTIFACRISVLARFKTQRERK